MTKRPPGRPKGTGDEHPSYQAVHYRVRREYGPARDHACHACGEQATQWAYVGDDTDPDQMTETTTRTDSRVPGWSKESVQVYSTNLALYKPLCARCHALMDNGKDCGHDPARRVSYTFETSQQNGTTRTKTEGVCRDCANEASRRWRARRKQFEHDRRQAAKLRKEGSL